MDSFFQFTEGFVRLDPGSREALSSVLQYAKYSKGKVLLKPGGICNYIYFIKTGLTRTFYFKNNKDVTDWLSPENSIAVSIVSYITRKPDRRGIELLEDSEIIFIHHDDLEKLCRQHHEIESLTRKIISFGLIQLQKKFDDLHFATGQQRYNTLMVENPSLIQRVPLGMIASYLGITQETLSRVRSKNLII